MSPRHLTSLLLLAAVVAAGGGTAQTSTRPRTATRPTASPSEVASPSPVVDAAPTPTPVLVPPPPPPAQEVVPAPKFAPVFGFDFSPYTVGDGPGANVPDSRLTSLLSVLRGRSTWIKLGSVTGGDLNAPRIAKAMGFKVAAAAYISGEAAHDDPEIQQLETDINSGWVDLAMIGSEAVWNHFSTAEALAARMVSVRADINGRVPVATVEPDQAWFDHPILAQHADVVVANITPFSFHVPYAQSLSWLRARYARLQRQTHKTVYIGETEWASDGGDFGGSVANPYNAAHYFAAVEHWARANNVGVFYFEAFDEPWLSSADSKYGPHWGVYTDSGALKPGMDAGFLTP